MRDRILIQKDLIPYNFSINLGEVIFDIDVDYNETADLFTITLYKDGELIVTEPIIYNVPLFTDVYMVGKYPVLTIVPYDESEQETAVTWDNFNETVFLSIDNVGDDDE